MPLGNVTFRCSTVVSLEQILVSSSYYGVMLGKDSDERNRRLIARSVQDASRVFQYVESHVIEPIPASRLPEIRFIAELGANHPIRDTARMCSYCVLIWFQDAQPTVAMDDTQAVVGKLRWEDVAVDADY